MNPKAAQKKKRKNRWKLGDPNNGGDSTYVMIGKYAQPVGKDTHRPYYSRDWHNSSKSTCPAKNPALGLKLLKGNCFRTAVTKNNFVSLVIKDALTKQVLEIYDGKNHKWIPFQPKVTIKAWVCYYEAYQNHRLQKRLPKNDTLFANETSQAAAILKLKEEVLKRPTEHINKVQIYEGNTLLGYLNPTENGLDFFAFKSRRR